MANKILIALDRSEAAWAAVEYVAHTFGKTPGVQVTLLHILPGLPPEFWDHGHIIASDKEKESLHRVETRWEEEQEKQWQNLMKKAQGRLEQAGIPQEAVTDKFKPIGFLYKIYRLISTLCITFLPGGNFLYCHPHHPKSSSPQTALEDMKIIHAIFADLMIRARSGK